MGIIIIILGWEECSVDQAADVTGVKICLSAKQFSINHEASASHCSDVNKPESEHLKNSLV